MPRIPLYNQGQGPAVQLATGSLSRQASMGAFTAPGKALVGFGEKAADIAFQFGMAEKKAEADRITDEILVAVNQEFNDFTQKSESTTVADYQAEAKTFSDSMRQKKLEAYRNTLTRNQFRAVESAFNKAVAGKIATGSSIAFTKHQAIRSNQANETVQDTLAQMRTLNPQDPIYINLQDNLDKAYDRWASQGLSVASTKASYRKELSAGRFNNDIQSASSHADINRMRANLEAESDYMSSADKAARIAAIDAQEKIVDAEQVNLVYTEIVERGNDWNNVVPETGKTVAQDAIEQIQKGDTVTLTNEQGEKYVIELGQMKASSRDALIAKVRQGEATLNAETLNATMNGLNARVQDMSLAELRNLEETITNTDKDGKFIHYPEIKDFNSRQKIEALINGEIRDKAIKAVSLVKTQQADLVARLKQQRGIPTDSDVNDLAQMVKTYQDAELYDEAAALQLTFDATSEAASNFAIIEFGDLGAQKDALAAAKEKQGTAVGAKAYEVLTDMIANRDKEIKKDFVGYYMAQNPDAEMTANDFVALQTRMGIPALDIRVTSNAELRAFRSAYDAEETYDGKAQIMNNFLMSYGENQNRVMRHLITTNQISLAENVAASDPTNVNMKAVLDGNSADGLKRIKEDVSSDDKELISDAVNELMRNYTSSVIGGITDEVLGGGVTSGRASHVLEMRDIVKNTAGYLQVLYDHKSPEEVAQMAYDTVIGGKFAFGTINGNEVRYDKKYEPIKEQMTAVLTASINEDKEYLASRISYPPTPVGRDPEAFQQEYLSDLMNHGTWRTTTDNKSVYLVDQLGNVVPVKQETFPGQATRVDAMAGFITVNLEDVASAANKYIEMSNRGPSYVANPTNRKRKLVETVKLY